jgi:hypothetical protein
MIFIIQLIHLNMCEKRKNGQFYIDPCLQAILDQINASGQFRTLLSCCGHKKYHPTIIIINKITKNVFEYFSGIPLGYKKRKPYKYYKKDPEGYYYLPERNT